MTRGGTTKVWGGEGEGGEEFGCGLLKSLGASGTPLVDSSGYQVVINLGGCGTKLDRCNGMGHSHTLTLTLVHPHSPRPRDSIEKTTCIFSLCIGDKKFATRYHL